MFSFLVLSDLKPVTSESLDPNNNSHFADVTPASLPLLTSNNNSNVFSDVTSCLDLSPLTSHSPFSDASVTSSPSQTSGDIATLAGAPQQLPSYQAVFLQPSTIGNHKFLKAPLILCS